MIHERHKMTISFQSASSWPRRAKVATVPTKRKSWPTSDGQFLLVDWTLEGSRPMVAVDPNLQVKNGNFAADRLKDRACGMAR